MAPLTFGTKAETLERLRACVKKSFVEKLYRFTVQEWHNNKPAIILRTHKYFRDTRVIIRSSAVNEDSFTASNAGHFLSIQNVRLRSRDDFITAVDSVISSYSDRTKNHQVFVQKYIQDVELSGVVLSRDKDTLAPYMIFNFDDATGRTDLITSGRSSSHKTLVIHRKYGNRIKDKRIKKIFDSILEIEDLFQNDALDVEFCYKAGYVHILQVRPIVKKKNGESIENEMFNQTLRQIHGKIQELNMPHPHLYGKQTAYGVMPDWNPAEMIGIKPRPLALSLYKELITDNIWAYQRDNYGYKNLRSFPLMISFAGHPYVDVRVDFNSWIPKGLNDRLSRKLVDFYIEKLKANPASHDKVEFEIVYSCYTFDLNKRLKELLNFGFTKQDLHDISKSLLKLTNKIIHPEGLYKKDCEKVDILEKRRREILSTQLSEVSKIYWLIEDCKRYGTLPFAGLARAAFIATQFLNSMVSLGIISIEEKGIFMNSLKTVAKQLSHDTECLIQGEIPLKTFLDIYGHLRPGTYDILSESYDENPNQYFDMKSAKSTPSSSQKKSSVLVFSPKCMDQIGKLLKNHKLSTTAEEFVDFLKTAIEGREYSKFVFTKSVHQILKNIKSYGRNFGFDINDMSFVEIGDILKLYSTIAFIDEKMTLTHDIERNKKTWALFHPIKLPMLICDPDDIYCFSLSGVEPNYVTLKKTSGVPFLIDYNKINPAEIDGKIVFIKSADPGFDWIFAHHINGLVTMYGGANSHMAVRASELNIPAVIGCGEVNFDQWKTAKKLGIDCLNKHVKILA